jgi:hypothetical protein
MLEGAEGGEIPAEEQRGCTSLLFAYGISHPTIAAQFHLANHFVPSVFTPRIYFRLWNISKATMPLNFSFCIKIARHAWILICKKKGVSGQEGRGLGTPPTPPS